ncbi:hypothetical protein K3495_g14664 [Podosphaera aphanis]|nr:hypothetical protein K3495_g14664 [Podosphaera aphanis]
MKPRAKKGFLVGYNSRNIYRILLLEEEMVIGTRDVTFDETLSLDDQQELVPEDESIPLIDFSMVPLSYGIVCDTENPLLRNSEPDSQENDNSNFKMETQVSLEEIKKLGDESKERNSLKVLAKDLHKPNDRAAIDPNNIISEKKDTKENAESKGTRTRCTRYIF